MRETAEYVIAKRLQGYSWLCKSPGRAEHRSHCAQDIPRGGFGAGASSKEIAGRLLAVSSAGLSTAALVPLMKAALPHGLTEAVTKWQRQASMFLQGIWTAGDNQQRALRGPVPVALCLLALLFDLSQPSDVAAGIAYLPFVLSSISFQRRDIGFGFAAIASALTVGALFFGSPPEAGGQIGALNSLLIIGALWLVAPFIFIQHRTNRTLKRTEIKLNAVVTHAVDGLISIDDDGLIEHFNPSFERIFGYKKEEVIGRNIEMLMSAPHGNAHKGNLLRHLSDNQVPKTNAIGREVLAKHKNGTTFGMELAVSSFSLRQGQYCPGILRDISIRKQVEERRALLAAIVSSSEDAIVSETLEGIITSWNAGAERLLGYSADQAIGKHISLVVPPEKLGEEERVLAGLREGQVPRLETARVDKSGRHISVSVTISCVQDATGRLIGASTIIRDISAQKEFEAALLRYTQALERSNKELDDFAYIASHDLKEPLRGLFNNATFLQEDYQDKLDAQGIKRLSRICFLSQRMEQLVNDLLYFSRLGRQELALQPTDLNAVIHDITSMMETTLEEQNATVTIPLPLPHITCDKVRITEVFRNLITNAVKYNEKANKIVEIGYVSEMETKKGVEEEVFYVRDNGIGIKQEFYDDIFRIFKRLNDEDENKKGTGVGLTFVRKILDRHGGYIWLESTPGEGTTFYFTLKPRISDTAGRPTTLS